MCYGQFGQVKRHDLIKKKTMTKKTFRKPINQDLRLLTFETIDQSDEKT